MFAKEVIAALRPSLPAQTLDHVGFALEDGRIAQALIEAVDGAVAHQIVVPVRVYDMVRDRATDGVSFRSKDARRLERCLRRLRTDAER
ncbi:hypothetical protein [Rhodococcus jostii]|uniref:hypothetical protein n=1 Tax=Rhodococcus jostii TaxID=132919 RepID=UPI003638DDC0